MSNLIDYAGMFPPANLDLETAFRNFLTYQYDKDSWMLGKFIISARKLISLSVINEASQILKPVDLTVLLTNENLFYEFYTSLNNDIKNIREFDIDNFNIKSFELKIPMELNVIDNFDKLSGFIDRTYSSISNSVSSPPKVFFELGINDEWKYLIPIFVETLADFRFKNYNVGFKFRTGGVTADSFPTIEQVSLAVFSCNNSKIPFKATAGLHHPVRHFDENVNTHMHGFFNIFGAGILTYKHDLPKENLIEIIKDENPRNFVFNNLGLEWKNYSVSKDEIEFARHNFMISFGSCSFDEPREDLRNLNLLN